MSLTSYSGRERQCVGERKIKTRVAQLFVTYKLQWYRKTMYGREKDKDKSSSIICHLQTAVVEKDNVWGEKDKDKSISIICHLLPAVVEKDNVWGRER